MRELAYDIVIIGSGAGGATVAKELAPMCSDGVRIAVLEAGCKLSEEAYTGGELSMVDSLYFDSGGIVTKDGSMTLATGKAYGGSTVVYTGTSLSIPEEVLDGWRVPGLDFEDLERRSRKYIEENNVHFQPESSLNDNNLLFRDGCEELGWSVEQFPLNLKGCRGTGVCNLGCPNGAKQGTNRVQLPAAESLGVEVVTNCEVTSVGDREIRATVVEREFGEPSTWEVGDYLVKAKIVAVCAGALHTSALLLASREVGRMPMLGRCLTLHPALILVGEHKREISNFRGHPKSFFSTQFWKSERFLLESCMYFPFTTAKNLIGFGPDHAELMRAFPRLQMILVLAIDRAVPENRIVLDRRGAVVVDYTLTEEVLDSLHSSMKAAARVFFAAGAARIHAPAGETFFIERRDADRIESLISRNLVLPGRISVTSAHLMGGCRMGRDRADSVTDSWGRVHDVPWLFVADASLFAAASEVNPYLTVMALADRVSERIRSEAGDLLSL